MPLYVKIQITNERGQILVQTQGDAMRPLIWEAVTPDDQLRVSMESKELLGHFVYAPNGMPPFAVMELDARFRGL